MKIVVKLPTRQRPAQCVKALNLCIENQTTNNVHYLLTVDSNDRSMDKVIEVMHGHENITIDVGVSKSKIDACNRGLNEFNREWDIVVLCSDDMICQQKGWDQQLIDEMSEHYPDTDGVLFHNDGYLQNRLNTMCILGRKYYDRFMYIYHPDYTSFWSDNEFQVVADRLKKQTYFDLVLFKHEHPANTGSITDSLYIENNTNFAKDKRTFDDRQSKKFPFIVNTYSNN